ncbi:MAG TPA: hypothetical protein VMU34_18095, partial [Mycobacterium sp.]|nr:hypothetical protein [Mycobacterium sp.]
SAGVTTSAPAQAVTTTAGTIIGEGGDGLTPIMTKLLHDDGNGLKPDFGSYTGTVGVDQAIADFVGDAKGSFGADYVVTERPLTQAEAAKASSDGRSFAYVPILASPVALMTLVPSNAYQGSQTILPSQFCQHIDLNLDQLDALFGAVTPPLTDWGDSGRTAGTDPRIMCPGSPATPLDTRPIGRYANLDPSMENYALMSLLDSTTTSKTAFASGLTTAQKNAQASTSDPTASEIWPYNGTAIAGGDQTTLGKLIDLNRQQQPSEVAAYLKLGAIMPVDSDWTGAPLGVVWNLPTAAVQNAAQQYVAPSADAAKAALADATLASTSTPATNNLVTFNATATDNTAYNNFLMLAGYLVVPTNGLPADKARALAQLIRFAVGGTGQTDITAEGAAPATKAMVAADLAVAQQLDATGASGSTDASGSTTTTTAASSSSLTGSGTTSSAVLTGNSGAFASGGSSLASTGANLLPLVAIGLVLLVSGEASRRWVRRRRARAS